MSTTSIFFNQAFDKKRLKAFLYWVLQTFGEKEGLIVVEQLKSMGFSNATKAGLSIGLPDLKTPSKKKSLIFHAQVRMRKNDQEFQGAELTATERSQRIIDTWHRTSEDLRKQVVDYFSTYDQFNSVYMMALSGARGNFSQVRQLIGMRGLMADPQGQIISFPIRSNLREGLTLTEYFISCSGARKGLVDTALRTADTGYLTRRLVDISHHIVIKRVTCYTSRGIALKRLRTPQKILLSLRDRLVGRVLAENVYNDHAFKFGDHPVQKNQTFAQTQFVHQADSDRNNLETRFSERYNPSEQGDTSQNLVLRKREIVARKNQEISPDLAVQISLAKEAKLSFAQTKFVHKESNAPYVLVRSPLTCAYTHELCQLCYGWSMAQGSLVSLGEAVGVIAGQSIGEPGTQLTMRTFHTGGVFSGDLLQEIRAPHSGKIFFPKALIGLLIRTSQGRIAFLIKVAGELLIENASTENQVSRVQNTRVHLEPSTILFVRQGEKVKNRQILAELAITTEEGNQPIKSRQTLFSEIDGRIIQWKSMTARMHQTKGALHAQTKPKQNEDHEQSLYLNHNKSSYKPIHQRTRSLHSRLLDGVNREEQGPRVNENSSFPSRQSHSVSSQKKTEIARRPSVKAYLGPLEVNQTLSYAALSMQRLVDQNDEQYQETWGSLKNVTLKKRTLAKRHGLSCIEPVQALQLGLLGVIATRIGSSESECTRLCRSNSKTEGTAISSLKSANKKSELNKRSHTICLQYLHTIAREGDLVNEDYNQF